MTRRQGELLLVFVILARSTSFIMSKFLLQSMGSTNVLAIRFTLAFLVLCVIFRKRIKKLDKNTLIYGTIIGIAYILVMVCEMGALKHLPTGKVSFLEGSAVVLVPIFEGIIKKKMPGKVELLTSLVAFIGIGLITLDSGKMYLNIGEIIAIMGAVFYAFGIISTDRFAKKVDPFLVGIVQIGVMGLFTGVFAIIMGHPVIPHDAPRVGAFLYLALVCTVFGFTFQSVGQKATTSEMSGLIAAINPVSASIIGAIVLSEPVTLKLILGAVLIVSAIISANLHNARQAKKAMYKTVNAANTNK